ncbi:FKBP-type peptidyl-prolyl cis-trans isomerase [Pedobacter sp. BS3]|uniref:FKBP-type peptidyl-prolyl cis-trans isomerase n=1 Tax=Pedobacter sp. BS3 TaxID=2567937 RepID=UPI001F5BDF4B|nr:FKBP-type peptidyl-prolyl cis-trans isomerase [Pedobacter sp. BS3]
MKKVFSLALLALIGCSYAQAQSKKDKAKAKTTEVIPVAIPAAPAPAMKTTPKGLQYTIFTDNSGKKIKLNDVITFNFIQKTDKDSVLMNSYEHGSPAKIQVQESKNIADLMEVFPLLAEKDSALIKLPTDSIFKDHEDQRPPFLPKGSSVLFTIKVEQVQTLEEALAERQKIMDQMKMDEKASLAKYIADNKLELQSTPSGLLYRITKPSTKPKPVKGDTVYVNYTGRTVDGKVFDSSVESVAKTAGLQQPGRTYEPISVVVGEGNVIPGWDEGLLLFNEGASGQLLIQSDLAYGERGAGEDIKPFSSLIFDIDLVKVKKPKTAATTAPAAKKPVTTAKKPATPVKKAATPAKPAAKPATKK